MSDDTIYRQQVLDLLIRCSVPENGGNGLLYQSIKQLPSAEREGKWIFDDEIGWPKWTCSVCGGDGRGDYVFCPWCGAKMDTRLQNE